MKTREDVLKYGLSFPDTYQDAPFHEYHQNKEHWNTIILDGSIPGGAGDAVLQGKRRQPQCPVQRLASQSGKAI